MQPGDVILPDGHLGLGAALMQQGGALQRALPAAHHQHPRSAETHEITVVTSMRSQFGWQSLGHRRAVGEQRDTGGDQHPAGANRGTVTEGEPESARPGFQRLDEAAVNVWCDLALYPKAVVDEAIQRYRRVKAGARSGAE